MDGMGRDAVMVGGSLGGWGVSEIIVVVLWFNIPVNI